MKNKLPSQAYLQTWINRELEILNPQDPVAMELDTRIARAMAKKILSQEEHPKGLAIEMSQQADFHNVQIMGERHYAASLGVWAPVICNTQSEADYLTGLCLVLGYSTDGKVFVRGITEDEIRTHYGIETPPTYVRIPRLP